MTRAQLRSIVQTDLNDAGLTSTFFQPPEINDSLQDAYNEIVCKTRCNVKKVDLNWVSNTPYLAFKEDYGVSDYLGTIAIFNKVTNLFLRDDVSLRDYDRIRRDWENWNGNPQFWAPHSLKYIAIAPNLAQATGGFTLYYWATPGAGFIDDSSVPIVATDMQVLFEQYSVQDLLETAEEPTKGTQYTADYNKKMEEYAARCKNLARADVLLRI